MDWTKTEHTTTHNLRWIKFKRATGGTIYIREDLIEAFDDNLIKTTTGQSYPGLVGVIKDMEKS